MELEEIIMDSIDSVEPNEMLSTLDNLYLQIQTFNESNFYELKTKIKKYLRRNGYCPECGQATYSKESYQCVPYSDGTAEIEEWTAYCVSCGWEE